MIKVASNIQRMLVKQAQSATALSPFTKEPDRVPPNYVQLPSAPETGPIHYTELPANNFWSPFRNDLRLGNRFLRRDLNNVLYQGNRAYDDMVGPDGIPLLLSNAQNFASDTQAAADPIAREFMDRYGLMTQGVEQGAGLGNKALNYVEQQIPAAQASGRTIVDAATGAANQVAPYVQQYGQAVNNAATGLGSRLRDIGKGLLNNPLGR